MSGDNDAFGIVFARHRERLWAVALRTLGDPDDAGDALQDAMISAFRRAGSFRGDSAVTTWLHRIVVNACLDLARRRASRPSTSLDAHGGDGPALDVADNAAAAQFDAADTTAVIHAALRRLPTDLAAALVLVDIEGLSVRETADVLEVPEGTVKSRCARARARLAEALADLDPRPRNAPAAVPVQPNEEHQQQGEDPT